MLYEVITEFARDHLGQDQEADGGEGEVYLVGGAVMCLALEARPATKDVDAYFRPASSVREAARRVAARAGVAGDWLNDAVKAYLSPRREFRNNFV